MCVLNWPYNNICTSASDTTLYLKEKPFNDFANRADLDQAALVRAACSGVYSVCSWKYDISDPTQVDLTWVKVKNFQNPELFKMKS